VVKIGVSEYKRWKRIEPIKDDLLEHLENGGTFYTFSHNGPDDLTFNEVPSSDFERAINVVNRDGVKTTLVLQEDGNWTEVSYPA
jgi:hypothetical protein